MQQDLEGIETRIGIIVTINEYIGRETRIYYMTPITKRNQRRFLIFLSICFSIIEVLENVP